MATMMTIMNSTNMMMHTMYGQLLFQNRERASLSNSPLTSCMVLTPNSVIVGRRVMVTVDELVSGFVSARAAGFFRWGRTAASVVGVIVGGGGGAGGPTGPVGWGAYADLPN
jgi:hypothetical protein